MLIEQPPTIFRMFYPEATWRIPRRKKTVYLTFDDGPVPEVTPWVLDTLDNYGVKATFFCVGDNVAKYPEVFEEVKRRGHRVGNHTMNHVPGFKMTKFAYLRNIMEADALIGSNLFRPPYGRMGLGKGSLIGKYFRVIMYDLVTRDYSKILNGPEVLANVKQYARNGSIIVFHDSLKAQRNMQYAMPRAIEWLRENGYNLEVL